MQVPVEGPAAVAQSRPDRNAAVRIMLAGRVQGVGFRPFVCRLASEHGLTGYVRNRLGQVEILACGSTRALDDFRHDLLRRAPPFSQPEIVKIAAADVLPGDGFEVVPSTADADASICVPPDYFMCDDCRRELNDPADRRFRYPFINCTQCGPRYTLIKAMPYDRANTSMRGFALCPACETEYRDPADRRFHAEPVACPACGPRLSFVAGSATVSADSGAALDLALNSLRNGQIVAVKGVGGYHLMCDARDATAVATLRQRKQRPEKPFAVMFPLAGQDGLAAVRHSARLQESEARLLAGPLRPIVLVERMAGADIAGNVAPGLRELGVLLPYSPLHQLLLEEFGAPLVATSGNISGEPVQTDNDEARRRLAGIADGFLDHDRPIVRPADDPVFRTVAGRVRPIRIGRGSAPCELRLPNRQAAPVLSVGGHMKGTVALSWDDRVVVSPHIGEMDSRRSLAVFEQVAADLQALYGVRAERIACDAHPGYTTHRWARAQPVSLDTVWHHRAHASALAGEYRLDDGWLAFTWDGVGLGEDGTLWGGEALLGGPGNWARVASLRPFRLPGGDRAGREPWRSAAALQWECGRVPEHLPDGHGIARAAWARGVNCPTTSAAGRLFDAAAAIVLNLARVSFEAQGPMYLESLCRVAREPVPLPVGQGDDGVWRSDWEPLLAVLCDRRLSTGLRAEIFHSSMAMTLLQQALRVRDEYAFDRVGLCGGVFQNRVLTGQVAALLENHGFRVFVPAILPCNDAALSFGQAVEVAARQRQE